MALEEHIPQPAGPQQNSLPQTPTSERRTFFARNSASDGGETTVNAEQGEEDQGRPTKWSMGVLNDPLTHEVPGTCRIFYF
jgi:hypothetical protein